MCGIACRFCAAGTTSATSPLAAVASILGARGPDAQRTVTLPWDYDGGSSWNAAMCSAVLHMRGEQLCAQPVEEAEGGALLFNGEVWGGLPIPDGVSDTAVVSAALSSACAGAVTAAALASAVQRALGGVHGPFAFIYCTGGGVVAWGRDRLGRRSLLEHRAKGSSAPCLLSSVCPLEEGGLLDWAEVRPGVHAWVVGSEQPVAFVPWDEEGVATAAEGRLPTSGVCEVEGSASMDAAATALVAALSAAVRVRVRAVPPSPRCGEPSSALVYDAAAAPATISLALATAGLALPPAEAAPPHTLSKFLPCDALHAVSAFLGGALPSVPASVAVLFSGGVDCTVLARLAHEHVLPSEPIDLVNVCFAADRRSPDRVAAWAGLRELQIACPGRVWRLLCVDDSLGDAVEGGRAARTTALLRPSATVMDWNIGSSLWAAAQGVAFVDVLMDGAGGGLEYASSPAGQADGARRRLRAVVRSAARVLLSGMGADEQLGGYGRHRSAFAAGGWAQLDGELREDVGRMHARNCGRDDRLVSDAGRELRLPFLDESVMALLRTMPLPLVADMRLPPGTGDKRLLRTAAAGLGLPGAARLVKRAIQFGSRIAKAANLAAFGSSRAANRAGGGGGGGAAPLAGLRND